MLENILCLPCVGKLRRGVFHLIRASYVSCSFMVER